jgi:dihydrofolate reductase
MKLAIIVAASENDAIGRKGELPWTLPRDLARFRLLTEGHAVILGSTTQRSIEARLGMPLPLRFTIVLSRGDSWSDRGVSLTTASSIEEGLSKARSFSRAAGKNAAFVAGGASVYLQLLPVVDRVYLTRVHASVDGDAFMPCRWLADFTLSKAEKNPPCAGELPYSFLEYSRTR